MSSLIFKTIFVSISVPGIITTCNITKSIEQKTSCGSLEKILDDIFSSMEKIFKENIQVIRNTPLTASSQGWNWEILVASIDRALLVAEGLDLT